MCIAPVVKEEEDVIVKTTLKKWIGFLSVVAMVFCMSALDSSVKVSAEEQPASKYVDTDTVPANIKALLELREPAAATVLPEQRINAIQAIQQPAPQILNTDDLGSILLEDANGKGIAKVFGQPIRYADEDGQIHFIDTSMTEENALTAFTTGYDFRNTANAVSIRYSKKPDKGIRIDRALSLAVYNPNKIKLPKGYAEQMEDGAGRMVYPEAFGTHTYVEYINTNTGVKRNTVLEQNIGVNRFDFVLESKTYIPVLSEDASSIQVVRKDDPSQVAYVFYPLYVYDSCQMPETEREEETRPSREPILIGPAAGPTDTDTKIPAPESGENTAHKHFTEDNHYEVTALAKGIYRITSVVSEGFLNHPETVYPVIIDPSIRNATNSNSQDSYVWEGNAGANYGNLDYLRFGRMNGGDMLSYFRFNQIPSLPTNVTITDASLKFTFRPNQTTGADGICFIVTSKSWNESDINWTNQPFGSWGYGSSHNNFKYYNFYVKPFVEMWYYGGYPNYGVDFTYGSTINDYNSVVSSEGDAAKSPTLTIWFETYTPVLENGVYYIRSKHSSLYLDAEQALNSNVIQYGYHGELNQQWKVTYIGSGFYTLTNLYYYYNGKVLEIAGGVDANGTNARLYSSNNTPAQYWRILDNGDGSFTLMPARSVGRVLDVAGVSTNPTANVHLWDSTGADNQKWCFERAYNYGYKGYAIYRHLGGVMYLSPDWHSAFMNEHYSTDIKPVIHVIKIMSLILPSSNVSNGTPISTIWSSMESTDRSRQCPIIIKGRSSISPENWKAGKSGIFFPTKCGLPVIRTPPGFFRMM